MPLVDQMCRECGALEGVSYVTKICDKCKEGTEMQITKKMLGEALKEPLDFDFAPGEENIFVKEPILKAARRVYENWDALENILIYEDGDYKAIRNIIGGSDDIK